MLAAALRIAEIFRTGIAIVTAWTVITTVITGKYLKVSGIDHLVTVKISLWKLLNIIIKRKIQKIPTVYVLIIIQVAHTRADLTIMRSRPGNLSGTHKHKHQYNHDENAFPSSKESLFIVHGFLPAKELA